MLEQKQVELAAVNMVCVILVNVGLVPFVERDFRRAETTES